MLHNVWTITLWTYRKVFTWKGGTWWGSLLNDLQYRSENINVNTYTNIFCRNESSTNIASLLYRFDIIDYIPIING